MSEDSIKQAARILAEAEYAIAYTGAEMSAERGIPTFRDPGGHLGSFRSGRDRDKRGTNGDDGYPNINSNLFQGLFSSIQRMD